MIATQVLWSGYALFYDHYYAYSPDPAAAKFLSPYVQEGATIAVTYISGPGDKRVRAFPAVGILPYFDHNIYVNTPYPFWWWSDQDPTEDRFNLSLPSHPRIVIVEETHPNPFAHLNLDDPKYVFAQGRLQVDGRVLRNPTAAIGTWRNPLPCRLRVLRAVSLFGYSDAKIVQDEEEGTAVTDGDAERETQTPHRGLRRLLYCHA